MLAQARETAVKNNCPFYDGVGEIQASESPYVIVLTPNGMFGLRVRRKFVEAGVLDDVNALFEEAFASALEDFEEANDCDEISDWDENDLWIFRLNERDPVPQTGTETPIEKS